jgi:hypothetical protein
VWSSPRPGRFTPGKDPVPIVQESGWASGQVWTCAKNLAPTGIRSPDRPARRQSLYRLSYPGPRLHVTNMLFLSDFTETSIFSTDFQNRSRYQIPWKFVQCEPSCSNRMDTDRQTDVTKLLFVLRSYANASLKRMSC